MLIKVLRFRRYRKTPVTILLLVISNLLIGQTVRDTLTSKLTLSQCITYALANQSMVKQSFLDEDITKRNIRTGSICHCQ